MSIGTNIATLIAIGVATVSAVIVAFAGFQYATASGDPQKIGIAKSSFVGAFIGLVIASLAFIGPRIVTDMVIKAGGGRGAGYAGRAELRQRAQEPTGSFNGGPRLPTGCRSSFLRSRRSSRNARRMSGSRRLLI